VSSPVTYPHQAGECRPDWCGATADPRDALSAQANPFTHVTPTVFRHKWLGAGWPYLKLMVSDEAIEAAAKAMAAYAIHLDPEEDPDQFMTWDEMDEEDREKMRGAARATIEAALPLLKYEVRE
jgi:hypothetical protein